MHPEARRMAGHMGVRLCACTKDEKSRKVAEILQFLLPSFYNYEMKRLCCRSELAEKRAASRRVGGRP